MMEARGGKDSQKREGSSHAGICRRLAAADLEMVMEWRMSPHVTKYMNTDQALTMEGQQCWFERISSSGELCYWIIVVGDAPCGVINLSNVDMVNRRCGWGYYVAVKELRSFNLAISLESSLYDYAFGKIGLNKVTGESFCANTAAIKMHELCGCMTEGILRQHIYKNGQYHDVCVQSMLAGEWMRLRASIDAPRFEFF